MQEIAGAQETSTRSTWEERPWAARFASAALFLIPFVTAAVVIQFTSRVYLHPGGVAGFVVWLFQLLIVAIIVSHLVGRALERFAPLPGLLRLKLEWPDVAPSRLNIAFDAQAKNVLARTLFSLPEEEAAAAHKALASIADQRNQDRTSADRAFRLAGYADLIAAELELDEEYRDKLRWSVLLHNIGLTTVPQELLLKRGALSSSEMAHYQRHPTVSAAILQPLADFLGPATPQQNNTTNIGMATGTRRALRETALRCPPRSPQLPMHMTP